jgi:Mor family transcriptional regulator
VRLFKTLGYQGLASLIAEFSGEFVKIPNKTAYLKWLRNIRIYTDRVEKQYTYRELSKKWGLSVTAIVAIVKKMDAINTIANFAEVKLNHGKRGKTPK